jgi:hypothetical protein
MKSEEIKEICKLLHMKTVCTVLISKAPIAYTNENAHQLINDMKIRDKYEEVSKELEDKIKDIGIEKVNETFSNKEIMQDEKNRFTFDDQRQATFEVIGKKLTIEEFLEKYGD